MTSTMQPSKIYLGMYESLRFLGEGGMGKVFLGRHRQTGREVVIKVMHEHLAQDPKVKKSFEREMQVMMRFRHAHAVALLDGSLNGPGEPCLIMEYIRGRTLEDVLKRHGHLPVQRVGRLLGQLCLVLHAAHGGGILHRDLAPGNIMIVDPDTDREQIKVMDFGLARNDGFYVTLDQLKGRDVIEGGTPDYLCPEQIRGDDVDHRGDLYSVGAMLFEMLTGQVPFAESKSTGDILRSHLHQTPPSFASLRIHEIPPAVECIVQACLAKYPHERPQNARDLISQVEKALSTKLVPAASFSQADLDVGPVEKGPASDTVLDRFQAWMPEAVAIMKLRGFIEGVGGRVVDSVPGLITMRVHDQRGQKEPEGFFARLGLGRQKLQEPPSLTLELHFQKKQEGGRSLVEIAVALRPSKSNPAADAAMRQGFGQRLCRELRAYLMIGR